MFRGTAPILGPQGVTRTAKRNADHKLLQKTLSYNLQHTRNKKLTTTLTNLTRKRYHYANGSEKNLQGSHPESNSGHGPELVGLPAKWSEFVRHFGSKLMGRVCKKIRNVHTWDQSQVRSIETSQKRRTPQSQTDLNNRAQTAARKRQVSFRFL